MANIKNEPSFIPSMPLKSNKANPAMSKLANRPLKLRAGLSETVKVNPIAMEANAKQGEGRKKKTRRDTKGSRNDNPISVYIDTEGFSSSEDFQNDVLGERKGLFPERRSTPIKFDYKDSLPLSVMQLEDNFTTLQFPSGDTVNNTPKMMFNLGNYARSFVLDHTTVKRHMSTIFNRYSRDIIAQVKSKIIDTWTLDNFMVYLRSVISLMEMYYCVDSILSYEASLDKKDRNPILVQMKTEFSDFDLLVKHDEAKRILKNCWLPDKFSALIAWTYQNYKTGTADQCANYRIFSYDRFIKDPASREFDAKAIVELYTANINSVTTVDSRNIISLLCQTYPQGRIGRLPLSCSEAVYDPNHYEFMVNQGIIWPNTDAPFVTSQGFPNNEDYNLYSSEVSPEEAGCFPFVLNSTYDEANGDFSNGLFIPRMRLVKQNNTQLGQAEWSWATNKFFAFNEDPGVDTFEMRPRNLIELSTIMPIQDTHIMRTDSRAESPDVGIAGCNSMSKGHFQNLYFNTKESRLIVMREFLNSMFYLK